LVKRRYQLAEFVETKIHLLKAPCLNTHVVKREILGFTA
jgi:hypothetical protein